jgi:hypothetical protein
MPLALKNKNIKENKGENGKRGEFACLCWNKIFT